MRDRPDAVMLFAAGFGTRMGALTRNQPKPLIKVGGQALLDHTLTLARSVVPSRIVVNAHYLPDQIAEHLVGTDVAISLEHPDILETGGGLRHARPLLGDGPVFTANTDAIWQGPNPFKTLLDAWRPDEMDGLLLCVPRESAIGHAGTGDFVLDEDGRLSRGAGQIYGGIQILKTDGLSQINDTVFSLNLLWNQMAQQKALFGLSYPGQWCDVGSPAGLDLAENLLRSTDV